MSNNNPISAGEIAVENTTIEKHMDLIEPIYPRVLCFNQLKYITLITL